MSESTYNLKSYQKFWLKICQPAIAGLMNHAGTYSADEKENNLRFVEEYVTAWLGPQPASGLNKDSSPLDVASPLEASINFSANGKTIVRFQFEPLGATVGMHTSADPFGQTKVRTMLSQIENQLASVDMRWATQFIEAFFPRDPAEVARVRDKETSLPFPLDHALTFNVAFDLDGARKRMKTYFFPMAKSFATGRTGESLVFNNIKKLDPCGADLTPPVNFLEDFFNTYPDPLTIDMVGLDCADPSTARIKVYAHLQARNSWNTVKSVYTFGDKAIDDTRKQGLKVLRSIWHSLLDEKEALGSDGGEDYNKPLRYPDSFLGSLMFSFEIVPGSTIPEVKTYVPLWQYGTSDRKIAENLASIFQSLGWHEAANGYLPKLMETFPGADLDGPSALHSNISFAYSQRTGVYITVYYAVSGKAVAASKTLDMNR
ncbi:hypothetical protein ZTR_07517 [Talaromyces verruculosus]|nr:hypothetical protein ZTR_07517 [Talaromyces verruculosus]